MTHIIVHSRSALVILGLGYVLNGAPFASTGRADDNWKNWHAVTWRDASAEIVQYARQMGYDHIGVRDLDFNFYKNNPDCRGLKFFIVNPHMLSTMYDDLPGRSALGPSIAMGRVINTSLQYTPEQIKWYNQRHVWKSRDPFPRNLASGYFPESNSTRFHSMWDVQQQAVIDELIRSIVRHVRKYESPTFTFAGYMIDVPKLAGDFFYLNGDRQMPATLAHWTGADTGLLHDAITHEYPTHTDGMAAFYKQLNARLRQEFPGAKWVLEPAQLYSPSAPDEWLYGIRNRADKADLVPDFLAQEEGTYHTTDFVDDANIFQSGLNVSRNMVGSSQSNEVDEYKNRLIAAKAGMNGAWCNWFGRWGGFRSMPNFRHATEVYPRLKLVKCIPNWDNLNNIPLGERSWDDGVYRSPKSFISGDVMYSRHPKTKKLFVVFNSTKGVLRLNAGERVESVKRAGGYFEEAEDGKADFEMRGTELRLRGDVKIEVDAGNGQVKGNGYIVTLSQSSMNRGSPASSGGAMKNNTLVGHGNARR